MKLGKISLLTLVSVLTFGTYAIAQVIPVPQVQNVQTNDLFQDVTGGSPQAPAYFATAAQIAGVPGYSYQVPLTGFAITPGNAVALLHLNPAGTLATGTLTLAANPGDGQRFCLIDSQTQTAITIAANTGQTLGGITNPTALVANTQYCWYYNRPNAIWYRIL